MSDTGERIVPIHGRPDTEAGPRSLARRELADALRELCHGIGASHANPEQLREIAAALRTQLGALAAAEPDGAPSPDATPARFPGMEDFHDRSPIAGLANPLAPPASLGIDEDAGIVVGEVTFGPAFEGAPGICHGGFVAAVLDEALGMASALSGRACMTAELTTTYRQHTPIATPLRIEARLDSVDGRKVLTSGEVYAGETVLVTAKGFFIAVDVEKFQALAAARAEKQGA
jgi:acyl-coenzyme A thioesterase PaaI-like protein